MSNQRSSRYRQYCSSAITRPPFTTVQAVQLDAQCAGPRRRVVAVVVLQRVRPVVRSTSPLQNFSPLPPHCLKSDGGKVHVTLFCSPPSFFTRQSPSSFEYFSHLLAVLYVVSHRRVSSSSSSTAHRTKEQISCETIRTFFFFPVSGKNGWAVASPLFTLGILLSCSDPYRRSPSRHIRELNKLILIEILAILAGLFSYTDRSTITLEYKLKCILIRRHKWS